MEKEFLIKESNDIDPNDLSEKGMDKRNELNVNGYMKSKSDLRTSTLTVNGFLKNRGSIYSENLTTNGVLFAEEDIQNVNTMKNNGYTRANGRVKTNRLESHGHIKCDEIEAEECMISGKIKVNILNCNELLLSLSGKSKIRELVGSQIEIKLASRIRIGSRLKQHGIVKMIDADYVDIENVKCDKVCGETVKIGPSCIINTVEYSEHLEVDKTSKVKNTVKI
ncbi:hypothetical protein [Haloplasma contractile]|uniref:Polymer-forming cytoskeletal protein n=1 Tax=Haloplasma contractile SSD-17B TaxID=1033810 RepID=U2FPK2_9MOLU|nr:hypothetical protein [Haloplasma contractile]ERJ12994.1 hypothetical protein HLPCO_000593 [Haloplasma contractile SSD-17B]